MQQSTETDQTINNTPVENVSLVPGDDLQGKTKAEVWFNYDTGPTDREAHEEMILAWCDELEGRLRQLLQDRSVTSLGHDPYYLSLVAIRKATGTDFRSLARWVVVISMPQWASDDRGELTTADSIIWDFLADALRASAIQWHEGRMPANRRDVVRRGVQPAPIPSIF